MSNTQHNVGASASEGAEAVSYPLPDWGPELEHSEKALDRFIYKQEPAGPYEYEFRDLLALALAEVVAAEHARFSAAAWEALPFCMQPAVDVLKPFCNDKW